VVRVDTGVYEGAEISMLLRPDDRQARDGWAAPAREAIDRAVADALDRFARSMASVTIIDFLTALAGSAALSRPARMTTGFIAEEYPEGFKGSPRRRRRSCRRYRRAGRRLPAPTCRARRDDRRQLPGQMRRVTRRPTRPGRADGDRGGDAIDVATSVLPVERGYES
jgi:propionyl-CoA carboxylase alpha chain